MLDNDHPRHAEAVGHHAKARRKEGLGQRHLHLATAGKRVEHLLRFGLAISGYPHGGVDIRHDQRAHIRDGIERDAESVAEGQIDILACDGFLSVAQLKGIFGWRKIGLDGGAALSFGF